MTNMETTNQNDPVCYLTFRLGEELFALRVAFVREILELSHITRVPAAPAYMKGVIDVRGTATAVMDLRTRFGLPEAPLGPGSRIIIMQYQAGEEEVTLGGIADSVHDVLGFLPDEVVPAPRVGLRWRPEMIEGTGLHGGRHIILLDLPRILGTADGSLLNPDSSFTPAAKTQQHFHPFNKEIKT